MIGIPDLALTWPRKVRSIHQVEVTSRCSLSCCYCPSPQIVKGKIPGRDARDMTREHYLRTLEWVAHYVKAGTQGELNLAGTGESTLHPDFIDFLRLARETMGDLPITFATNGVGATEEMVAKMAPYKPLVWVSLHRPEKAGPAIEIYKKHGILTGFSNDPALNGNDWAGQVKWYRSNPSYFTGCRWMRDGELFVFSDGRITTCGFDASAFNTLGHIDEEIGSVGLKPGPLCQRCHYVIGVKSWDQRKGEFT